MNQFAALKDVYFSSIQIGKIATTLCQHHVTTVIFADQQFALAGRNLNPSAIGIFVKEFLKWPKALCDLGVSRSYLFGA